MPIIVRNISILVFSSLMRLHYWIAQLTLCQKTAGHDLDLGNEVGKGEECAPRFGGGEKRLPTEQGKEKKHTHLGCFCIL